MKFFMGYLSLFIIGSIFGWMLEVIYRGICSKKLVNPGFLNGPFLPIYGFGVVTMYVACDLPLDWWWKLVIVCVAMTLIEFIAGLIFVKGLGIKLWDYSNRRGNIMGIICPLYSLFWTVLGAGFLFLVYPPFKTVFDFMGITPYMWFIIGFISGVAIIDFCISFSLSAKIVAAAKKAKEVVSYERFKAFIAEKSEANGNKKRFPFPVLSGAAVKENLEGFIASIKEKINEKHRKEGAKKTERDAGELFSNQQEEEVAISENADGENGGANE